MKVLHFEKFHCKYPEIIFDYEYEKRVYRGKIELKNISSKQLEQAAGEELNNIFFHIGISAIPYLFALDDFDEIVIKQYKLSKDSLGFFSNYFKKGLAEFRHRNGLNVARDIKILNEATKSISKSNGKGVANRALLLNGAGKDSAVAGEIVKYMRIPFSWYTLNPSKVKLAKIEASGEKNYQGTTMIRFGKEFRDNVKFRGHKPLSAFITFSSLISAYINKAKYIIAGNEYSSNFGNLKVGNVEINHQFTKTFEFERQISDYIEANILANVKYFSVLRPLYEIQIALLFSEYQQYFSRVVSCNVGQNKGYWCRECPKCAFVYLVLFPFFSDDDLFVIFGEDLFERKLIREHIKQLCCGKVKPFECVGTKKESLLALKMSLMKNFEVSARDYYEELISLVSDVDEVSLKGELLHKWDRANNFPDELKNGLAQYFKLKLESK